LAIVALVPGRVSHASVSTRVQTLLPGHQREERLAAAVGPLVETLRNDRLCKYVVHTALILLGFEDCVLSNATPRLEVSVTNAVFAALAHFGVSEDTAHTDIMPGDDVLCMYTRIKTATTMSRVGALSFYRAVAMTCI
jgi:hypothetical protein